MADDNGCVNGQKMRLNLENMLQRIDKKF